VYMYLWVRVEYTQQWVKLVYYMQQCAWVYTLGGQRVASGEMPILGIGPAAEYSEYSV